MMDGHIMSRLEILAYLKMIQFLGEVRQFKSKKLITTDIEYTVTINTTDVTAVELAKIPADKMIKVIIEIEE